MTTPPRILYLPHQQGAFSRDGLGGELQLIQTGVVPSAQSTGQSIVRRHGDGLRDNRSRTPRRPRPIVIQQLLAGRVVHHILRHDRRMDDPIPQRIPTQLNGAEKVGVERIGHCAYRPPKTSRCSETLVFN